MEGAGALVELGLAFVPVPGLQPAFQIIKLIWDSVQKVNVVLTVQCISMASRDFQTSGNRDRLMNLLKHTAETLTLIHHSIRRVEIDGYLTNQLHEVKKYAVLPP